MVRSTIPYTMLKESGFAEAEIAEWVKRAKAIAETVRAPAKIDVALAKTALTEVKEAELPSKELPLGTPLREAVFQQPQQSSTVFSQLEQSKSYSKSYRGYSEAELMQMDAQQLKKLGIAKGQDALYVVLQGENVRIILDPVPWGVQHPPEPEEDAAIKIAVRSYSSEIASIVKSIAMSPWLFFIHHYAVNVRAIRAFVSTESWLVMQRCL